MPAESGGPAAGPPVLTFAPRLGLVATVGVAALVTGALAAATDDPPGRILLAAVAVVLAVAAGRGAVLRPVLQLSHDGVAVRDGMRLVLHPWTDDLEVRLAPQRVRLLRADFLEVRSEELVVLLPAWRLGAPGSVVLAAAQRARPPHRRQSGSRQDKK